MREETADSEILLKLAEGLPESLLRELFPSAAPGSVRVVLRRLAGGPVPEPEKESNAIPDPGTVSPTPRLKQAPIGCMLYTDGASRGNPGEAGAGVVLFEPGGKELASRAVYLGQCTNNAAEYQALIAGLELALHHGCRDLNIFLDSELIVRQVTGEYRVKNTQLQPLYRKVSGLLERFARWQIRHVPRAENMRADELANRGIDERKQ